MCVVGLRIVTARPKAAARSRFHDGPPSATRRAMTARPSPRVGVVCLALAKAEAIALTSGLQARRFVARKTVRACATLRPRSGFITYRTLRGDIRTYLMTALANIL